MDVATLPICEQKKKKTQRSVIYVQSNALVAFVLWWETHGFLLGGIMFLNLKADGCNEQTPSHENRRVQHHPILVSLNW